MIRTFLATLMFAVTSFVSAQVATGTYPYGSFDNVGADSINIGSLNVHLAIPVLNKPGRGMPFYYTLAYDSSVYAAALVSGTRTWQPVQAFGWLAETVVATGYVTYSADSYPCSDTPNGGRGSYTFYDTWVYHDPFGGSHSIGDQNTYLERDPNGCDAGYIRSFSAIANDGSGYTLNASGSAIGAPNTTQAIVDRAGHLTTAPVGNSALGSTVTDTNGNQISVSTSGVFTDTTGTQVLTVSGAAPTMTLSYPTTAGSATYTIKYLPYNIQTAFGCAGVGEYVASSVSLVSEIDLPDSSKYIFAYEQTPGVSGKVTGRLASVTLPTNGLISYAYTGGNAGINCSDGTASGLTRTTADGTRTYVRSSITTTSSHTEITDGSSPGNKSEYDFVTTGAPRTFYETNQSKYSGAATGTPLLSRQTCYNASAHPCTTTGVNLPITQVDSYETLDGVQQHGSTAKYNAYGLQTEEDDYDFGGASARGALLQKETWVYPSTGIVNIASSDTVYDGSGTQISQTTYAYDETSGTGHAGVVATSGLPQHGGAVGQRGNYTTVTQWNNLGTAVVTDLAYEDTGNPLSTTTPNGTASFAYDSGTHAFLTTSLPPTPSSNVALQNSFTTDTATGLELTRTDPNSAQQASKSYDALFRLGEVDSLDSKNTLLAKTTYTYSANQHGVQTFQATSVNSDTETHYDGYGRIDRVAVANGQSSNGWYQQDTCYDRNGQMQYRSYPYQGAGFGQAKVCSGDMSTYDALGRLIKLTHADGTAVTYSYTGRATKTVDENGVARITQVDGLGRTMSVCELSSVSLQGTAPGQCAQDVAAVGYITNVSYTTDANKNRVATIVQGQQSRVSKTDSLGRSVYTAEPERGITTYNYTYNSIGLTASRVRPKANQTNASVSTTTTTQYDSVGRVVGISYDDGSVPKTFSYDTSAGLTNFSQVNIKGRLSFAHRGTTAPWSGSTYSYDGVGRVTDIDECLPSGCGTAAYDRLLHYSYDLSGNVLSSTDGGGVSTGYAVSLANEILSLTSSLSDPTHPANILSNVKAGPTGPLNFALGNGLANVYTYDTLGRLSGGWLCSGSISPNCSGGVLAYGYNTNWAGSRLVSSVDTVLNQASNYSYDDFSRLSSRTVTSGTVQNFTYGYDRYGNRWQQNSTQSGPSPQLSFSAVTNQITSSGYSYDAAGNLVNDGFHGYTYDPDGSVVAVDGGSTAKYMYSALNQRVQSAAGSAVTEYVYNAFDKRVSTWNGSTHAQLSGEYYMGIKSVAYYASASTHFQHQDWLGTERLRTSSSGGVEGTFASLPFGDAQTTMSGSDTDAYHFAGIDYDAESNTDHAQFRQYSSTQGRFLTPDPSDDSYDINNPQSLNRYAYVVDNPLSLVDPYGLDAEGDAEANAGCSRFFTSGIDPDTSNLEFSETVFLPGRVSTRRWPRAYTRWQGTHKQTSQRSALRSEIRQPSIRS